MRILWGCLLFSNSWFFMGSMLLIWLVVCVVLCLCFVLFACLSSSCVLFTQCCQCLWFVHSWLSLGLEFSLTFMNNTFSKLTWLYMLWPDDDTDCLYCTRPTLSADLLLLTETTCHSLEHMTRWWYWLSLLY